MISVRPPRLADRDAIARVSRESGVFSADETETALELFDLSIDGRDPDYRFLCAETDSGAFAGYACFGEIPLTRGSFDLYWIVVDTALERRGIGRKLIERVTDQLRDANGRKIYVETSSRAPYAPARAFYLCSGFRLLAEYPDFYAPGDAKVVFERDVVPIPSRASLGAAASAPGEIPILR